MNKSKVKFRYERETSNKIKKKEQRKKHKKSNYSGRLVLTQLFPLKET